MSRRCPGQPGAGAAEPHLTCPSLLLLSLAFLLSLAPHDAAVQDSRIEEIFLNISFAVYTTFLVQTTLEGALVKKPKPLTVPKASVSALAVLTQV